MTEEWRPCPGWETAYSVSSLGRVRRDLATHAKAGHILVPALSAGYGRTRYMQVRLSINNKARTCRVSSLVAEAFIGPRPAGAEVNHKDGDKTNNTPANLEYTSRRKNEDHAVANGLHAWGESHGMAKLTADAVREIRTRRLGPTAYARKFKVSKGAIDGVLLGKTWRHLDNLPMRERAKGITRSQAERISSAAKRNVQHSAQAEGCSWCGAKKENRYGMCEKCQRFPSQLDYERWNNADARSEPRE